MNAKFKLILSLVIAILIISPVGRTFGQEAGVGVGAGAAGAGMAGAGAVGVEIPETDIMQMLMQLVPQPPGSSIAVIPGHNKLIVRNTPSNIRKMERLIEELGTPPQVAIEAKFVVVGEETYRDLGLEWGNLSFNWANPIGRTKRYSGIAGQPWTYDTITSSITSAVSPPAGMSDGGLQLTYISSNYPQLQATLNMLSTRADTKFLSAPTVTTLNNEPAIIRFVTTIRYVDDVEVDTETDENAAGDETTNVTITWDLAERDVGIVLYVNPIVLRPTESVRLFLQPVVSEIEDGTTSYTIAYINGEPLSFTPPIFTSKDVTTNVEVGDGTTIVLGGLMSEETTELISKIPFLGDIPVIGKAFFQRQINSEEKQHLLIFITVNVLDSQGNPYFAKG